MKTVFLSLGSNQGDSMDLLQQAVRMLAANECIEVRRASSVYETDPVGYTEQPPFLNIVLEIATSMEPIALLDVCQEIERNLGRTRHVRWGPRTIDIDIALYEGVEMDTDRLTIPHPRMGERAFVLVPLAEIAPDAQHRGRRASDLAREIAADESQGMRFFAALNLAEVVDRQDKDGRAT